MRVSGIARDILLVPEPGTAWRHFHTTMISPTGRQLTLKGLATRNPTLLFSFVGSLLLRLDARRLFSLLFQEPPRSPRDEPDFSEEIIHVADVAFHSQFLLHEMIEAVEVDVREELAGQIPDGQAVPPDVTVEQILAPLHAMTVFMGFQDPLDQSHHLPVCNGLADAVQQDFMVDAREIPAQVTLEDVGKAAGEFCTAAHSGVSAFAFPAGVAVLDEFLLENRLQHADQRVMHHAVAEWRGSHAAELRLVDVKLGIGAGLPSG